jgi:hypothetical protein
MSEINSRQNPQIEQSIVDKIVDNLPDDLDFGGSEEQPDEPAARFTDLEPEDWDHDDDGDSAPEKEPGTKREKKPEKKPESEPEEKAPKVAAPKGDEPEPEEARPWPKDKGTRDKPLELKELPEDVFVRVKIDGQKDVVNLKEYASGIVRMETFHASLSRAKNAYEEASEIAHESLQERQAIRDYFQEVFKTPAKLFQRLMQDPDEMVELGKMIAAQYKEWHENPSALMEHKHRLRQRVLDERERRIQEQGERSESERRAARVKAEAIERWKPVHAEAMQENGFPKLTKAFQKKFNALFRAEWEETGGKVTPETYKELFREVLKLEKPVSTAQDRKPPPQADPPTRPRQNGGSAKPDWSKMSVQQKLRHPKFLMG